MHQRHYAKACTTLAGGSAITDVPTYANEKDVPLVPHSADPNMEF